ncbi:MAG: hypothetical protein AAGK32_00525 [Actinomycetota bacterium]
MHYRITVRGHVGERIEPIFPDLSVEDRHDLCVITGPVKDQAQLHGIIALVRDLNVPLLAVEQF